MRRILLVVSIILVLVLGAISCAPSPADFLVTKLSVTPTQIECGEKATVTIDVTNTGGVEGTYCLRLYINAQRYAKEYMAIASGDTKTATYHVTINEAGHYTVTVDGLSAGLTAAAPAPTHIPTPYPTQTLFPKLRRGQYLIAQDGSYLGILDSEFASKSIFNDFGKYGSEFSATSIWNDFGKYGNEFSSLSAFNDLASEPPMLFDGDNFVCYVTTNNLKMPRVSPYSLIAFAESMGWK